jgi:hypothetical protein
MTRAFKTSFAVTTGLILAATLTVSAPSTAKANGPMGGHHEHHEDHGHHPEHGHHDGYRPHGGFINGVVVVDGGSYVSPAPAQVANVFVYSLYGTDSSGQTQLIGQYFVTVYGDSTDWGGFLDAQNAAAASGLRPSYTTQFWRTTTNG